MSRSRRKPWITDYFSSKYFEKRLANKRIRRYNRFIPNGNSFKKLYPSWNICDYKWLEEDNKKIKRK